MINPHKSELGLVIPMATFLFCQVVHFGLAGLETLHIRQKTKMLSTHRYTIVTCKM